jgi:SAM-dependent methyltransferase
MTAATLHGAAARTFAGCAPFYDSLTAHHDYEDVARILEDLLARHGHPGRRMLDVACGTGKSFMPFVRRGYRVTACDISPEMLAQAREKANGAAELVVADMRDLPELGSFDLATCIDEPLNYLLEPDDVARTFASLARNLRPGGLVLFDVNTLHAFRSIFARDECYEQEGWLFVWRGHGDEATEPGGRSGFTIEAFAEDGEGAWTRFTNQHLQRHYTPAQIAELLSVGGLEAVASYGLTPDGVLHAEPDEGRHTKHFHVARKPTRSERG